MKKIEHGFCDYYYLLENGDVYNSLIDTTIHQSKKHSFTLNTIDKKRKKIHLKQLYRIVYGKNYCKDIVEDLENELWKEIDDTDQLYAVSNMGRIKSFQGYESIILKPSYCNSGGYQRVDLFVYRDRKTRFVHRIVAQAFLDPPPRLDMQLHHIDFNKYNNQAKNLIWLTPNDHKTIHKEHDKQKE